jgi:hypothetical protein
MKRIFVTDTQIRTRVFSVVASSEEAAVDAVREESPAGELLCEIDRENTPPIVIPPAEFSELGFETVVAIARALSMSRDDQPKRNPLSDLDALPPRDGERG